MDSYVRGQISTRDSVNLHTATVRRCIEVLATVGKREEVVDVYTLCVVCVCVWGGGREREEKKEREGGGRGREKDECIFFSSHSM